VRWRGNERVYGIDHDRWTELLGDRDGLLPIYVDWLRLLPSLKRLLDWLEDQTRVGHSDYMLASEARRLIEELQPSLESAGVQIQDTRMAYGADYWPVFVGIVETIIQMLRPAT